METQHTISEMTVNNQTSDVQFLFGKYEELQKKCYQLEEQVKEENNKRIRQYEKDLAAKASMRSKIEELNTRIKTLDSIIFWLKSLLRSFCKGKWTKASMVERSCRYLNAALRAEKENIHFRTAEDMIEEEEKNESTNS